jgi:phage terminase small subunit
VIADRAAAARARRNQLRRERRQEQRQQYREARAATAPLTVRQQSFVREYLLLGQPSEAARRAGYSHATANNIAYDLMRVPHVAKAIAEGQAAAQRRSEVTLDRVIGELAKLAFADPRDLFTADGKLKPIHQLDDDSAASIAAMEVLALASSPRSVAGRAARAAAGAAGGASGAGTGDTGSSSGGDLPLELRKIKRWDKTKALELLGRYLGLFKDRVELGVSQDLASTIEAARRRAQSAERDGSMSRPTVIDVDASEAKAGDTEAGDTGDGA